MKVQNMTSINGNKVANQFIILTEEPTKMYKSGMVDVEYLQSYDSIIVRKAYEPHGLQIYLDEQYWDYSVTTGKYRNQFLGETKKETQAKIDSGEYKLVNLND